MNSLFQYLPDIDGEEIFYINTIISDMTESQIQQFAMMYRSRRKDPQMILLLTLLGFLGIAGVERFIVGQIGMGILYLFTWGLCGIGTIIDLVNYKKIAVTYNQRQAYEVASMMRMMGA